MKIEFDFGIIDKNFEDVEMIDLNDIDKLIYDFI